MKILILTNFYPPRTIGGMEMTCRAVVKELCARNHQLLVLTSKHGSKQTQNQAGVIRRLNLEMGLVGNRNAIDFFTSRNHRASENIKLLHGTIENFKPDIVFIWGMWNLDRQLAYEAEKTMAGRVLYRFGDYWPTLPRQMELYWDEPGKSTASQVLKGILRPAARQILSKQQPVALDFPHSYTISQAVKDYLLANRIPIENSRVIHNGFDLSPFDTQKSKLSTERQTLTKLLFIGRLVADKGLHIAIDALEKLLQADTSLPWQLTIAGSGSPQYMSQIQKSIQDRYLSRNITFIGQVPSEEIPGLLSKHDVLIIPSMWNEPFGRVAVEGMAAGCIVVASNTGGLIEIIEDGKSGFLFQPGDADQLADRLRMIAAQPEQMATIAANAQQSVRLRFDIHAMIEQIEILLFSVTGMQPPSNLN